MGGGREGKIALEVPGFLKGGVSYPNVTTVPHISECEENRTDLKAAFKNDLFFFFFKYTSFI